MVAGVSDGHLLVYSETHIDVFEVNSGEWIQTLNLRRSKPLMRTGLLNMVMMSDLPHVAYLRNLQQGKPLMRTGLLNMVMMSDLPHVAYLRNLQQGNGSNCDQNNSRQLDQQQAM